MKLGKVIQQVLSEPLQKRGFEYHKEPDEWLYIRKCEYYKEYIAIDKSNWNKNAIRASYYNGSDSISSFRLIGIRGEEWHFYEDETSLRNTLNLILDITINQALPWFEMNRPEDRRGSKLSELLSEEMIKQSKEFIEKNGLNVAILESLKDLENILLRDPKEEYILYSSYYFGEIIVRHLRGEWGKDENGLPIIKRIGGHEAFKKNPYKIVRSFLDYPNSGSIYDYFKTFEETVEDL
ncbi:hypothetical protein [Paenibacillus tuaregi]|uniref:hypothetical protein n=1 Tax=Paenibacillus tuaregi TaxID=1816681 RepID=UPI0008382411|nr:hypothetical protein [Paenibacillus tuaregi]